MESGTPPPGSIAKTPTRQCPTGHRLGLVLVGKHLRRRSLNTDLVMSKI
jgi:hypothetical protein